MQIEVNGAAGMCRELLPAMLSVNDVAALLSCSPRHVYRLCDVGRMPAPVKLGALVRWPRAVIMAWIEEGCPTCVTGAGQ